MSALVLGWLGLEFRLLKSWRSQWFVQCKLEIFNGVSKLVWLPVTSLRRSQVLGKFDKFPNFIHVSLFELCNFFASSIEDILQNLESGLPGWSPKNLLLRIV